MTERVLGDGASCCGDPEACDLCGSSAAPHADTTSDVSADAWDDSDLFDEEVEE